MASIQAIAITKEQAYQSLRETTQALASRLGIDAPELDIHKRHPLDYRNAEELKRMAEFLERIVETIDTPQGDIQAVVEMVSQDDKKWTKAELKALVLGGD
jgi:hypothetical protein